MTVLVTFLVEEMEMNWLLPSILGSLVSVIPPNFHIQ